MTAHVDQAIERYFAGAVDRARDRDALFGHLDRCERCKKEFEAQAQAHRALAGGKSFAATELALIAPALLDSVEPEPWPSRWIAWAVGLAIPAAIALLVALGPITAEDPAAPYVGVRGSQNEGKSTVEVLCFDEKMQVVAHLKQDGRCPVPGYIKVVFASPLTVPHLSIAAIAKNEVRLFADLEKPEPRSVLADYAKIERGESLQVIAVAGDEAVRLEVLRAMPPALTVTAAE